VSCWNCHHQAVLSADPWPDGRARLRSADGLRGVRDRGRRRPAELEGAAAAGEPDRGAMAKLNDDQRRALEMLAHQDGCAEAALLADGFSIDDLAGLVVGGFAVMQRRRVDISGRMRTVVWMQITEAGRKAITDS
jgi:hypothetical protein